MQITAKVALDKAVYLLYNKYMLKDCVATLNITSYDLTLSVAERSVNGAFSFRALEKVNYYSYYDGEFYDIKELERKIVKLYDDLITNSEVSKISTIFVSVPGEFSKVVSKNYKITFAKPKKITEGDVRYLMDNGFVDDDNEYSLVHRSAVYYVVDNYKTHEPIGKLASSLSARMSYCMAINHFIDVLDKILKKIGITTIRYILQDFACSRYLFTLAERDVCKLLINVGYSSSSLSIVCGNGLLFNSAFPIGGGMISAYLSDRLCIDYSVAEDLKAKLNLGLKERPSAKYIVNKDDVDFVEFSRDTCNKVAKDVLESIAEKCSDAVSSCTLKVPSDIETAFTGEGISKVKGAVEYISTRLGIFPKVVAPKVPHYNKPKYSTRLALIDTALDFIKDKLFFTTLN